MQQLTKTVQEIGNGAHIYLPKELVGKKVVVTLALKSKEEIEQEVLGVLKPYLKHVQGIYLYGSYARNEQTADSDIDILVITDGLQIKHPGYDIISVTLSQLEKTLETAAVLILPILKEAQPILNEELIEPYKKKKLTKKNTKWYIETTESALKINEGWIKEKDPKSVGAIVYSLVMRLKGLCLIESLIHNKQYSSKLLRISHMIYQVYAEHRDEKKVTAKVTYDEIKTLYDRVEKYFLKTKKQWEKLS
jgi:predicted nucleotidyltransferase